MGERFFKKTLIATAKSCTSANPAGSRTAAPSTADKNIREQVRLLLGSGQLRTPSGERRKEKREAYPYPVYLTPVDKQGNVQCDDTVVVLGKHLSELGFDFYHREPLPYRRVIVSFELGSHRSVAMLLDLTWCRFGRHGWYDNGGRFLATVPSPLTSNNHPSLLE